MPTNSRRLGLSLPTEADQFETTDIRNNWEKIDAAPGIHICTSTTRPTTWGASQEGRRIFETNTGLEWWWNGTTFKRIAGEGLLRKSSGGFAIAERDNDWERTAANHATDTLVESVGNVVIPDGRRPIRVDVAFRRAWNATGHIEFSIRQSDTSNSGPTLARWLHPQSSSEVHSGGAAFWAIARDGLAAGTYAFSLQARQIEGGSSVIAASATTPITIMVTEL